MPFVKLQGLRFYYERRGNGPPLLFFNGSGGDLRRKPGVLDGPAAEHFDLLCHDQRGLGQSERPDLAYTMADYAEDAAALLDAVGWDRCRVLGVSFGGMVAQEFALRFGPRVEKLALACTSSGGAGGASYPLHELTTLPDKERTLRTLELSDTRMDAAWREAHPESVETLRRLRDPANDPGAGEPNRKIGARRQLEARREHDTWERLHQITAPTFCCGGRYDGIASPENMQRLAAQIPGAKLELFEGGHMFLMQDPRAWERLIEFLR